jgi:hypothetical protein
MPIENLQDLTRHFENITFVSFMTVQPDRSVINQYVKSMGQKLLQQNNEIWLMGNMTEYIEQKNLPERIRIFDTMDETISML